jgi:dTDP-glucose pyrophosphorylase
MTLNTNKLTFVLMLVLAYILLFRCSATYHLEKAVKKGVKIDYRVDTVRVYFRDSVIKDGFKEYFYNYRDTIIENNTVYVPKTRYETRTEYKIIKEQIVNDFELILLDDVTDGQLCTVLKASKYFKTNQSILIAASDSFIESSIAEDIQNSKADGIISVINIPGEQWSFAKINQQGKVIEVAEKSRISDYASTGLYYFKDSIRFQQQAEILLKNKVTTKGEYYVMPLYNQLIGEGANIELSHAKAMWDMGTPEAKSNFEKFLYETKI